MDKKNNKLKRTFIPQTIGNVVNKINRSRVLPYNDSIFGMVKKVKHLVKYEIME